ncbi:MAG: YaaR family protein [Spirochaetes bacterium]|nr:YaaR family protein [Spirochaetota bacterium]
MIEIVPPNQKKEEQKIVKRKKGTKSTSLHSTFRTTFESTLEFSLPENLDELLDDLKDQEKKFMADPSLYNMQRYKALVQKILKILVSDEYVVNILQRKRRDRADFVIIQQIQNKLEEITKAYITNNKAFDMLKTFDEIRGLILDLIH